MSQIEQFNFYTANAGYQSASSAITKDNNKKDNTVAGDKDSNKTTNTTNTKSTQDSKNSKEVKGVNTYGNPELSEKAQKYYQSLVKKFGNMNFVLVASDKKQEADSNKASFAVAGKMTVLIDTDKIEKMASDESYRKQIEGVILKSSADIAGIKEGLGSNQNAVKAFGMSIDKNGLPQYFAVVDKSLAKKKLEKKAAEKKEDQRVAEKKASEKKKAKAAKEKATDKISDDNEDDSKVSDSDTVTITASSASELLTKIKDYQMSLRADSLQTEQEKKIGQSFDYSI